MKSLTPYSKFFMAAAGLASTGADAGTHQPVWETVVIAITYAVAVYLIPNKTP